MMNIETGDYVTLKSIDEVKPLYKKFDVVIDEFGGIDCVFAEDEFGKEYYPHEMLNTMESPNIYKVVGIKEDVFLLTLTLFTEDEFWFNNKCIKDAYKVTKVSNSKMEQED